MKVYDVTLTGKTDLIFHWDNIEWSDEMKDWQEHPDNKKSSVKGDDRSPAWTWVGSCYHDGESIAIPQDNLMRCWMEGGTMVLVPGGRSGKTFKAQTQSGMVVNEPFWPVSVKGNGAIPIQPFHALTTEPDFAVHKKTVRQHGFSLFVKRAKVGSSKHVRVRPIFSDWSARGTITVIDDQITENVLLEILSRAGAYKGLGDWRPSGRTPGPYGRFDVALSVAS